MKPISTSTLALLAAALGCSAAQATGIAADATLSNFSITLIDLAPADGIAPSITFLQGDTVAASQAHVDDNSDQWHEQVAGLFGPAASTTTFNPRTSASSSFGGDPFSGGATLAASVKADDTASIGWPGVMAKAQTTFGKYTPATFELSPQTLMLVNGTATAHASAQQQYAGEAFAIALFSFQLGTLPDNVNQQSSSFNDYAQAWYGFPEATLQEGVHLSFVNATSNSLEGSLSGYAMAYGSHLAVPEPGMTAMLLAGLGLLGAAGRRGRRA